MFKNLCINGYDILEVPERYESKFGKFHTEKFNQQCENIKKKALPAGAIFDRCKPGEDMQILPETQGGGKRKLLFNQTKTPIKSTLEYAIL